MRKKNLHTTSARSQRILREEKKEMHYDNALFAITQVEERTSTCMPRFSNLTDTYTVISFIRSFYVITEWKPFYQHVNFLPKSNMVTNSEVSVWAVLTPKHACGRLPAVSTALVRRAAKESVSPGEVCRSRG
jgi:hypothetical protein